jgi:hypothetical protein
MRPIIKVTPQASQSARPSQLKRDLAAHAVPVLADDAGHERAGGDGDKEGRDLGNQPIAHRQHGVGIRGVAEGHAVLRDADQQPADHIHHDDDETSDAVALDELHRAVHRAIELAFALELPATDLCGRLIQLLGADIGIDRHLLAGNRVEGEARRDLGDALTAFGDHDELHDGNDQEDHQPDDEIAADDHIPEGVDDVSGVARRQNESRDADRQRQAKHRRHQDHGG